MQGTQVRIIDQAGNPWFVLADVCRVLEISNPRDAASRLDEDEKDGVGITDAIGREQNNTIINESGLYSLILTSRKDAAKRFKKWVTSEVLPTIRKTGANGATAATDLNDPDTPDTSSSQLKPTSKQAKNLSRPRMLSEKNRATRPELTRSPNSRPTSRRQACDPTTRDDSDGETTAPPGWVGGSKPPSRIRKFRPPYSSPKNFVDFLKSISGTRFRLGYYHIPRFPKVTS